MSRSCKKRKKSSGVSNSGLNRSNSIANKDSSSLRDEVFQHLQSLKESKGLVVGFNAVIRGIKNNSLSLVLFFSRRGTSAMYHALQLMCKGRETLLLQLTDIGSVLFNSKIPASTAYGIKADVLALEPKFSNLSDRINNVLSSRRSSKADKKSENSCVEVENLFVEEEEEEKDSFPGNKNLVVENVVHSKHNVSKGNFKMNSEGFLSLEGSDCFPDYSTDWRGVSIDIH